MYIRDIRRNVVNACAGHVQGDANASFFIVEEQVIQACEPGKAVSDDWRQGIDLRSQHIVRLFEVFSQNRVLSL